MRRFILNKIKKIKKFLIYLKSNWGEIRLLLLSSKSLLPWNNSTKDQIPWITFEAFKWLEKYLKSDMIVFEYGSGGSTLFFQKYVKKIISIEHNRIWYKKMLELLKKKNLFFNSYFLIEPEKLLKRNNKKKDNYQSTHKTYSNMTFKKYVNSIDKYPQKYFDVIFIDGRARISCFKKSITKIRQEGIIILDNSQRKRYQESLSLFNKYKRIDFYGFGPYRFTPWQTSVWFINNSD